MATQVQVLESIKSRPEGTTIADLAQEFGVQPFLLTKVLSDLRKKGSVVKEGELYRVTATTVTPKATDKPLTEKPALPSDFDEFVQIGESIGVVQPFLGTIANHIFRGKPYDIAWVYETLNKLHLRQDIADRWTEFWATAIKQPVPEDVKTRQAETTGSGAPAAPKPQQVDKWSLIGDTPTRDPENGQYTWLQCLQLLESRKAQPQPQQGNELLQFLINRADTQDKTIQQLLQNLSDERVTNIEHRVSALSQGQSEINRYGLMNNLGKGVLDEVKGLRGDVKTGMIDLARAQMPRTPMSPDEKTRIATAGKRAVADQRRVLELAREILSDSTPSPRPAPPVPIVNQ